MFNITSKMLIKLFYFLLYKFKFLMANNFF